MKDKVIVAQKGKNRCVTVMGTLSTPGTLKILVIGAEELDKIVTAGVQQPYYIIECGKQRSRSKPCLQNGTNPHWNTAHKFELLDETAAVAVIKDEMTKGIIAEGLIDLSRARLSGRDAATAQLRNLAGQPAGRLRFKLKFQAATPAAEQGRSLSPLPQRMSDAGGARSAGGIQQMVDVGDRRHSNEPGSLPYSRRISETNSMQHRLSEAGSYRSNGSIDGRRSITPPASLPYSTATLERGPSGNLRASSQQQLSRGQSGEEPDVVLASVTSKVSLAKQAMQQLTAELAELTGPGQSPPPQGLRSSMGSTVNQGLSPAGSMQPSAFAVAANQQAAVAASQASDSRASSRQGGVGLNVLGQPVGQQHQHQHQQQQLHQQHSGAGPQAPQGQQPNAWSDYKSLWQQQRQHQPHPQHQHQHQHHPPPMGAAPMGPQESWATGGGADMPMPVYQQQQYIEQRHARFSTGSLSPSGVYTPSGMMSPGISPRGSGVVVVQGEGGMGMPWPRLRGVFGNGVLSTEELVALYANSGAASEKKLINLLEEALAAAHAEKVATEQELGTVKQAMAEMSKQHYLDAKRLKEMTAVAAAAEAGAAHPAATGRSMTPPPRFRYEGTPPASPHGAGGGVFSMVDTKPSRRHSRTSDSADLRDLTHGLTISTKREVPAGRSASASAAAGTPDVTAAANAELTKLRAEHSQLQSATAALEQEIARLKGLVQRTEGLEQELQQLKDSHAKEAKVAAATAAAGAAGGAAAAAAAAAELNALRDEHGRVRALAESLEEEVAQLREASAQLQESQQQLDELQSEHATVKAAFTATQQQLEKLRQQQLDSRSVRSGSEFMDAAEDFEGSSQGGSPMPAYKLQIQVHQLERQLVEQVAKTQEEATKRQKMAADLEALQDRLDSQMALAKQLEDNARAAEQKAAEQATIAAAARSEAAEARAYTESSTGKEAQLARELDAVRDDLDAVLADKAELETALGLLDRNSKAQIEQLQADLVKAQEDAAALHEGSSDVASLQAQLAAAQEEASGLRNNSEEVEYLQAQLRRTLRQVVELQRQVQLLQQERSSEATTANPDQEAAIEAAIRAETDFLMQELVAAKLELAQVKEQQLITQRQLFKAQESMKQQHMVTATAVN